MEPPLSVTMIEAKCPPPSSPTAAQVDVAALELGAHETALTFANGEKEALVFHWGVVAPAGGAWSSIPSRPVKPSTVTAESAATVMPRTVRTITSFPPRRARQ